MSLRTWAIISLVWIAAVAYFGWSQWPRIPLDISSNDPATIAVYNNSLARHFVLWVSVALVPPVFFYGMRWLLMALPRKKT